MTNPLCLCGCGGEVSKLGNKYIKGHYWKGKENINKQSKFKGHNWGLCRKCGKDHGEVPISKIEPWNKGVTGIQLLGRGNIILKRQKLNVVLNL